MALQKDRLKSLLYLNEHLECENYLAGRDALFEENILEPGELFVREFVKRSSVIFILSGQIRVSIGNVVNKRIDAGNMLFVTTGDSFFGRAETKVTCLRCSFSRDMNLCNKFALKSLQKHIFTPPHVAENQGETDLVMLPIHPLLEQEVRLTLEAMKKGLLCSHFQRIKQDIIFMELRGLYKKEELARLFDPLISNDEDFKIKVLGTYTNVKTAKELMVEMNMSPSSFKRKFYQSFGTSPKQWLIQKKKEKLFRDIVMTDMSIMEIADKYDFTVNYVSAFCKNNFEKTPTELRCEYKSRLFKE